MTEGFKLVSSLIKENLNILKDQHQLFVFTDGKINKGDTEEPFGEAVSVYKVLLRSLRNTVVVDTESGFVKLGMASKLAAALGTRYEVLK